MSSSSYYDIDAILAEEELIPSTALFDFSHLSYLDPDSRNREHYLPENSRIKLPLWAVKEMAMLGYVRLSLPRHYGRRARERLEADPGDADLRKWNERFFMAGQMLVDLIERSSRRVAKAIAATRSRNNRQAAHTLALEQVSEEAQELRRILLKSYAGDRLRRSFDWALSSGGDDDVSSYLCKLTEMEQRLFLEGASAIEKFDQWSIFGNRRLISWNFNGNNNPMTPVAMTTAPSAMMTPGGGGSGSGGEQEETARRVTPGGGAEDDGGNNDGDRNYKRRRMG